MKLTLSFEEKTVENMLDRFYVPAWDTPVLICFECSAIWHDDVELNEHTPDCFVGAFEKAVVESLRKKKKK